MPGRTAYCSYCCCCRRWWRWWWWLQSRFYERLLGRLRARGQQLGEVHARLAGAERQVEELRELLRLREVDAARMRVSERVEGTKSRAIRRIRRSGRGLGG